MVTAASAATSCARSTRRSARNEIQIVAVNDLGDAKTNAHLTRYDTAHGPFPFAGRRRRRLARRRRRPHQGLRRARSVEAAVGAARRRHRARVHGPVHDEREGRPAPEGRREEGHHLGAGRQGRRRDDRLRRQPQDAEGEPHRDLERVVHDELLGAAREGAARDRRHRARHHDDDSRVHERPGADGRLPQRPAPRALGDAEHDPDEDRRRRGRGPRAAGARRQARRLRGARADDQRLARRPHVRSRRARRARRRSTRPSRRRAKAR